MKLAHLATSSIIISRRVAVGGTFKGIYSTVTGAKVNLQPIGAEKTALMGGVMGKTFMIFADVGIDIKEHDRLRDYFTGKYYRVKRGGVTTHSDGGAIEFQKVIIEEVN